MISSIWENSESGKMAVNLSKAISTLTSNVVWRILAKKKFTDNDLDGDFKGFKDLLVELIATVGEFNIGDFIPYLDWLDLQGINRRMKKIHKVFDEFAEKIIDDHVNARRLNMAATSLNDQKEAIRFQYDTVRGRKERMPRGFHGYSDDRACGGSVVAQF